MNNFNFDLNEYIEFENKILSEVEEVYGGDKIFDLNKIISDYDEFKSMYGHIYYVLEEYNIRLEKPRKMEKREKTEKDTYSSRKSPKSLSDEEIEAVTNKILKKLEAAGAELRK